MPNELATQDRYIAEYETDNGTEIKLSLGNVRELISTDESVTDKEIFLFVALCKERKLNPFVKEAYLVKYGSKPAQLIVGKDYYSKVANRHPAYDGCECGVTVMDLNTKEIVRREGSMFSERREQLIGGWCRVYRKDRAHATYDEVSFAEYSTGRAMWKMPSQGGKPGTQIRKVAYVHAHREAFPEEFNGLYDAAEMGDYEDALDKQVQAEVVSDPAQDTQCIPMYEEQARAAGQAAFYEGEYEADIERMEAF